MAATKITVNNNGSLIVEGDFEIVDKNGNIYDLGGRERVSICRCGLSKNKPFCDASHKGHFEHEAIAFALPPKNNCHPAERYLLQEIKVKVMITGSLTIIIKGRNRFLLLTEVFRNLEIFVKNNQ